MGIGKSSNMLECIRFFNSVRACGSFRSGGADPRRQAGQCPEKRYIIFVSTITERDGRFLKELDAKTPEEHPYIQSLANLVLKGENIVTTKSLFTFFNENTIEAFRKSKFSYTAYFDEMPDLFRETMGGVKKTDNFGNITSFGKADVLLMQEAGMILREKDILRYNPDCDYDRSESGYKVFDAVKKLSCSSALYPFGDRNGRFTTVLAFTRREAFACFQECWIYSYRTWGSLLHNYCILNNINMVYYHINDGRVMMNPEGRYAETCPAGMERLVILDGRRFNIEYKLTKSWFKRAGAESGGGMLKNLKTCFRNAYEFMKKHGVRSDSFYFTTFTEDREMLDSRGKHYPSLKRFLPCNTKATNDYSECTGVAYVCNRFFDVSCTSFLSQKAKESGRPELQFDNDNYALTELLQFIYRSNLRVRNSDKKVYVWVPDRRMRRLLQDYQKRALQDAGSYGAMRKLADFDRQNVREWREKRNIK